MKCDKLEKMYAGQFSPSALVFGALYVEEAIAELKQAIHDAEMAKDDAEAANTEYREDIKQLKAELRATRRALFLARTEWARSAALSYHLLEDHPDKDSAATYRRKANKWENVQKACAKYAEKIKGEK